MQEIIGLREITDSLFTLIQHQRETERKAILTEESPVVHFTDIIQSSWTDSEQIDIPIKNQTKSNSNSRNVEERIPASPESDLPSFLRSTNEVTDPNEQSDPSAASESGWSHDLTDQPSDTSSRAVADHKILLGLIAKEKEAKRALAATMSEQAEQTEQTRSFIRKPRKKTV